MTYLSHEHLDELTADYRPAIEAYIRAKGAVAAAQREYDEAEATLAHEGLIYAPGVKEQGTNDSARKLYARVKLADPWGKSLAAAELALVEAEAQYELMRREWESFKLHLQLEGLSLKGQELRSKASMPIVTAVSPMFDLNVGFGDAEAMLEIIRKQIGDMATGLEKYGEVDQEIAKDLRAIIGDEEE